MKSTLYFNYYDFTSINFDANDNYYKDNSYVDNLNKSVNNFIQHNYSDITDLKNDTSCEAILINETIDTLIQHDLSSEPFYLNISFNFDTMDEEFEEELKQWIQMTKRVNNVNSSYEWKMSNLPLKQIKFKVLNNYNKFTYGILDSCMIVDFVDKSTICVLVKKLMFTKDL